MIFNESEKQVTAGTRPVTQQAEPRVITFRLSTSVEPPRPKKSRPLRTAGYILLMIALLALTLFILLRDADTKAMWDTLMSANLFYVAIASGLIFLQQLVFGYILLALTSQSLRPPYPRMLGFNTAMIGFFFNNITPSSSGGQPMEIYYLYRCGVSITHSTLSFVMLSLYYYSSKIIFGLFAMVYNPALAWTALDGYRFFYFLGFIVPLGMIVVTTALIFRPAMISSWAKIALEWLIDKRVIKRRQLWRERLEKWTEQYVGGSDRFKNNMKLIGQTFVIYLAGHFLFYQTTYFSALAIGERPPFWDFFALQSLYFITATSLPTPGGVGLGESSFVTIFRSLMEKSDALAVMLLSRSITLYLFLIVAGGVALYAFATAGKGRYRLYKRQ